VEYLVLLLFLVRSKNIFGAHTFYVTLSKERKLEEKLKYLHVLQKTLGALFRKRHGVFCNRFLHVLRNCFFVLCSLLRKQKIMSFV
jgi:hypothetical protein